ncbi:hypothetical protein Ahy_B08g094015 [Arachis hypogaea]|uniref:PB1-like domain-containing protein n=1 Tax=Arachis hypogaea TaxID=3818 RepID=A0A444Y7L4_ARAHY|nr:hypothetical protein Ahy_B08g094015 [Arachis hypogaea]
MRLCGNDTTAVVWHPSNGRTTILLGRGRDVRARVALGSFVVGDGGCVLRLGGDEIRVFVRGLGIRPNLRGEGACDLDDNSVVRKLPLLADDGVNGVMEGVRKATHDGSGEDTMQRHGSKGRGATLDVHFTMGSDVRVRVALGNFVAGDGGCVLRLGGDEIRVFVRSLGIRPNLRGEGACDLDDNPIARKLPLLVDDGVNGVMEGVGCFFRMHYDSDSSTIMVLRRFSGVTQRRRCLCGTATATLESQNDVVSWGKTNESPHVAVLITVRVVVTWAKGLMNAELLDIMFHHGGNFERGKDGRWTYTPDNRHCLGDLDVDRLDVFYLRNYFKEIGYETMKEVWWQVPGMSLEVGLRRLDSDNELRELCNHGGKNNGVVDVYIEHGISEPEIVQGEDVVVHVDDEVRDLGEQAKSNARMVKDPLSNLPPRRTLLEV